MNLSQEPPIMNSKNNIWGEWKPHWKKKRKYLLKIHSPPTSMGNLISHPLLRQLRMAVLIWVSSLDVGVQNWTGDSLSQDSKPWAKPWMMVRAGEFYLDEDAAWSSVLPSHRICKDSPSSTSQQSTERNIKNLNVTNLTDLIVLQNTSNRQVTAEVVLPHC